MVTLNVRVGAVALVLGSCGTAALSFLAPDLTPLRLLSFAVVLLGSWAFADEMGIRKPLNRAGLVAIAFAGLAKTLVLLGADPAVHSKYLLLYAFALLIALLLWSVALLHRDRRMKIMGAFGTAGAVVPIILLVAGHVIVGAGAILGVSSLYELSGENINSTPGIIRIIEAIFFGWGALVAIALWSGQLSRPPNELAPLET